MYRDLDSVSLALNPSGCCFLMSEDLNKGEELEWFRQNTDFLNQGLQMQYKKNYQQAPCRNISDFPSYHSYLLEFILSTFPDKVCWCHLWYSRDGLPCLGLHVPLQQQQKEGSSICMCLQGWWWDPICSSSPSCLHHLPSQPCFPRCLSPEQGGAWREQNCTSATSSALAPGAWLCHVCFTCWSTALCHVSPSLPLQAPGRMGPSWPLCAFDKWLLGKHPQQMGQMLLLLILQSAFPALPP